MAGIKGNNAIKYNKKLRHFKNVNFQFTKNAPQFVKEQYYLPDWDNLRLWNKSYQTLLTNKGAQGRENERFKIKFPTLEKFRDYCYKSAENGIKGNLNENCHTNDSWCSDCLRDNDWSR